MMKKFFLFAAGCAIASAFCLKAEAQIQESCRSYIEVNGYAEREVAPDVFYMNICLDEQDTKRKKSLEEEQHTMIKALKTAGIDTEKQLKQLSLDSRYFSRKTNLSRAEYELKLTRTEDVSKVWRVMDGLGISKVSFTKAECSRIAEVKGEVQAEAVRNAKAQAQNMAEAIGQQAGKCFYIFCSNGGVPVLYAQNRLMTKTMVLNDSAESEEAEETVHFGHIKVTANVSAKFALE